MLTVIWSVNNYCLFKSNVIIEIYIVCQQNYIQRAQIKIVFINNLNANRSTRDHLIDK